MARGGQAARERRARRRRCASARNARYGKRESCKPTEGARYPYWLAMTARQRRRHRRSQGGSVGKKVLLAFSVLFALVLVALGSVALWVQDIRADAPDIDTLKPLESGANSEVFAADGSS